MGVPIKITFEIQLSGPLHIGTGFRRGLLHRTVMRDGEGYVTVPGSTLKGKVRAACEDLARLHELEICGSALPGLMCGTEQAPCIVCRIFGSPAHPSSLYWHDARLIDELKQLAQAEGRFGMTEARTQVQMSRLRGVGMEDRLYTTETARRGLTFTSGLDGWLDGIPLDSNKPGATYELLLLLAGLRAVDGLGGLRSRGSGECRIESITCDVDGQRCDLDVGRIEELMLYTDARQERRSG